MLQRNILRLISLAVLAAGLSSMGCAEGQSKKADTGTVPQAPRNAPETRLLGLTPDQVRAAMGEPVLKRSDHHVQVWQYAGQGCVMHLFLFEKPAQQGVRVQYLEAFNSARHAKGEPVMPYEKHRCLLALTAQAPALPPAR